MYCNYELSFLIKWNEYEHYFKTFPFASSLLNYLTGMNVCEGSAMMESMDIIEKVDADNRYGSPGAFKPASTRTDLKEWQKKVKATNSLLQRSRYMMVPMPEFHTKDGRDAFVKKHPVPPYDKPGNTFLFTFMPFMNGSV